MMFGVGVEADRGPLRGVTGCRGKRKRVGGAVPPAQTLCRSETRWGGEDTGSRDDLQAEQGGGSGPWEIEPVVTT